MEEQEIKQDVLQEDTNVADRSLAMECRKLLSPCSIDAEDTSHLAVDDLRFALEQANSRNIAVTGHYGSGKSSVANTCIEEMGIGDEVLRISMSTFALHDESKPQSGAQSSDEIEYKIVQHLLYKCDKSKIPYSRFQLIQHIDKALLEKYIKLVLIAFVCFIIAFEPAIFQIDSFYEAYDWFFGIFGKKAGPVIGKVVNTIADAGCVAYLIWFAFKVGVKIADKINRFRNFKFEAKGVSLEASTEVSVFNRYLEEIIYILEANHYNYILFEDLDRLDNSDKLFLKIRELNMLINESEAFKNKNRVVKFIYAIRDDVFTRELRTKCFDYIVAVVPVVDHYNVTDYLIKEYKKKGLFKTVDAAVLEQLLKKVSGLRELKNIVNEYTLFEKSLKVHISEDLDNYEQKLLAVIVYKNLYPQDFSRAYKKEGLFYSVFQNKELFYEGLTKELNEELKTAIQRMNEARSKIVDARKQYLEKMNDGLTVIRLIKDGYDYTLDQVANKDNLFEWFTNDEFDRYTYREDDKETFGESDYDFKFEDLEKKVTEDLDYYEAIDEDQNKYTRANEDKIKLEKEIKVIENTSLQELIKWIGSVKTKEVLNNVYVKEYPAKEKKEQAIDKDMVDTLQTMLYGGYVSEDYYLYISKFYEGSTSESDYQFTNAILQGAERPYDHKLNNAKSVVGKLKVEDFKEKNVLNYDILNYLLDSKQDHFLISFIETARKNPAFIVSYSQMANPAKEEFFARVFDGWDSCVNIIRGQEKAEEGEVLLKLFFKEASTTIKLKDEEIEYLEGRYEFIHNNIQMMDAGKLKKFIRAYNLCFETLVKPNKQSQEFYNYCLVNKRFVISKNNMEVILGEDWIKKPMTAILGLPEIRLKNYLIHNQKSIVQMFEDPCDEEERMALVYIIKENVAAEDWIVKYLTKQQYIFDVVSDLDGGVIEMVLKADKMVVSWTLILDAMNIEGELTDSLNGFITKHASLLSRSKCSGSQSLVTLLHQQLFAGDKQSLNDFKQLLRSFDQSFMLAELEGMNDERIAEVIRQKKVNADPEIFKYLNDNSSDQVADDYLLLHFDALLDEESIEWDDLIRNSMGIHVLNSRLTLEQKKRFLNDYLYITKDRHDTWELAKLVCFYFNQCGLEGSDKDLIIDALTLYQGDDSWEQKIMLINKCNAAWDYDTERENKLLSSLGGGYNRLTYPRGWAEFEINEHNRILLGYLKEHGHYINKVDEKEGKYYVTFKHS